MDIFEGNLKDSIYHHLETLQQREDGVLRVSSNIGGAGFKVYEAEENVQTVQRLGVALATLKERTECVDGLIEPFDHCLLGP